MLSAPAPAAASARPADGHFARGVRDGLVWLPELGMGHCVAAQVAPSVYDQSYWDKYVAYAGTGLGLQLTRERCALVQEHGALGHVLDVGIGCGAFVEAARRCHGMAYGYDVNPVGARWLKDRGWWLDPYEGGEPVEAMTCWDTLEHVHEPALLVAACRRWLFVSLPIFRDAAHVLASRHYRKDEHVWYWTREGLIGWARTQGFACRWHGTPESLLGREDVHTFVFERVDDD